MKVLVTGGGGFLGRAILAQLGSEVEERRSFSRGVYPELDAMGVIHHQGSLCDLEALCRAAKGVDVIYHTAALPGAWGKYQDYFDANVVGSRNVMEAARLEGVQAVVHTSTPSVVHANEGIRGADESMPLSDHFLAHYPKTKAIAEREVLALSSDTLRVCALRPHLIWGPGDRHLIPRLAKRARAGRLRLIGHPTPRVDSCYIHDAARAHILAARDLLGEGLANGRAYFISQGEPWAIDDLTCALLRAVGIDWSRAYVSKKVAWFLGCTLEATYRMFFIQREPPMTRFIASQLSTDHWFDISAAKNDFGFEPSYTIQGGLNALKAAVEEGTYAP